jgi:hypothetical protein
MGLYWFIMDVTKKQHKALALAKAKEMGKDAIGKRTCRLGRRAIEQGSLEMGRVCARSDTSCLSGAGSAILRISVVLLLYGWCSGEKGEESETQVRAPWV